MIDKDLLDRFNRLRESRPASPVLLCLFKEDIPDRHDLVKDTCELCGREIVHSNPDTDMIRVCRECLLKIPRGEFDAVGIQTVSPTRIRGSAM